LARIDCRAKLQIRRKAVAIRVATGRQGGAIHVGRGWINGMMIAKANTIVRQFLQSGRIFFGNEIGAHAIPNDKDDVTRLRCRYVCHHRGGLSRQSRDYDQKEFSEADFQQRDFRLKQSSCHPERSRGIPSRKLKRNVA